jgi:hypothetical protein
MRHTLSRAFTVGGLIGVLAVGAAALTLPGTSTGRPARPGRTSVGKLLETIVVPAGQTAPITAATTFKKGTSYTFVVSGSVTGTFQCCDGDPITNSFSFDPIFCYDSSGTFFNAAFNTCASPRRVDNFGSIGTDSGLQAQPIPSIPNSNPWVIDKEFLELHGIVTTPPTAYEPSHTYTLQFTPPVDLGLAFSDGSYWARNAAESGSWTIQIYGPSTETVKFGAALHHQAHERRHAFEVTNALGVGQIVVPTPKEGEFSVKSTSAKGTIKFHKLKVSTKGVLLLDETSLTLGVKSAIFSPDYGGKPILDVKVVVTKSAGTDACPKGSPGTVVLVDGEPTGEGDAFGINIPACKLKEEFHGKPGGGAGKAGFVTVAIIVVKPQPPA